MQSHYLHRLSIDFTCFQWAFLHTCEWINRGQFYCSETVLTNLTYTRAFDLWSFYRACRLAKGLGQYCWQIIGYCLLNHSYFEHFIHLHCAKGILCSAQRPLSSFWISGWLHCLNTQQPHCILKYTPFCTYEHPVLLTIHRFTVPQTVMLGKILPSIQHGHEF